MRVSEWIMASTSLVGVTDSGISVTCAGCNGTRRILAEAAIRESGGATTYICKTCGTELAEVTPEREGYAMQCFGDMAANFPPQQPGGS